MNPDDKLQSLFAEMRAENSANTPSFRRMVHPARLRPQPAQSSGGFPRIRFLLATSTALVLAIGAVFLAERHPAQEVNTASWSAVSNWNASTDSLLSDSQSFSASTFTTPSDSWLENMNSTTTETSETDKNL